MRGLVKWFLLGAFVVGDEDGEMGNMDMGMDDTGNMVDGDWMAEADPEPEPEVQHEMDDNLSRPHTYCLRVTETFDSKLWVKTYPSKNSRLYHFDNMLKKRNAINVHKSVSFSFKRNLDENNIVFVNPCEYSTVRATVDHNPRVVGANMHNMEYCHDPIHFISQDRAPIQYVTSIQFAFNTEDGQKFNRNKKTIMRELGFNKLDFENLKRYSDGHSDECHVVHYWRRGNLRDLSEQEHDFTSLTSEHNFTEYAHMRNENEEWFPAAVIPKIIDDLENQMHGCSARAMPQSIYERFDCQDMSFDHNECLNDPEYCHHVFSECLGWVQDHSESGEHASTDAPFGGEMDMTVQMIAEIAAIIMPVVQELTGMDMDGTEDIEAMLENMDIEGLISRMMRLLQPLMGADMPELPIEGMEDIMGSIVQMIDDGEFDIGAIMMILPQVMNFIDLGVDMEPIMAKIMEMVQFFSNMEEEDAMNAWFYFHVMQMVHDFVRTMVMTFMAPEFMPTEGHMNMTEGHTEMGDHMQMDMGIMGIFNSIDMVLNVLAGLEERGIDEAFMTMDFDAILAEMPEIVQAITGAFGPLLGPMNGTDEFPFEMISELLNPIMQIVESGGEGDVIGPIVTGVLELLGFFELGIDFNPIMEMIVAMVNRFLSVTDEEIMTVDFVLETMHGAYDLVMTMVRTFAWDPMLQWTLGSVDHFFNPLMEMFREIELNEFIEQMFWVDWMSNDEMMQSITGFIHRVIRGMFTFLAATDLFYEIPELSADSLISQVDASLQQTFEMISWFESMDHDEMMSPSVIMMIMDGVLGDLHTQLMAMDLNMYEMIAQYITMGRWAIHEGFSQIQYMMPDIYNPLNELLGGDVLNGVFRIIFQIVFMLTGEVEHGFRSLAEWAPEQAAHVRFLMHLMHISLTTELEGLESAMHELMYENMWISHPMLFDVPFTETAHQLFHLWGVDDFSLIEQNRTAEFLMAFAEEHGEKLDDIVWVAHNAEIMMQQLELKTEMMGFDGGLVHGPREELFMTLGDKLSDMLFQSRDDDAKFMFTRAAHVYGHRTMELFDMNAGDFYMAYTEGEFNDMYHYVHEKLVEHDIRLQDLVAFMSDCNWIWYDFYTNTDGQDPHSYFMNLLTNGYGMDYEYVLTEEISADFISILEWDQDYIAFIYANTTLAAYMAAHEGYSAGDMFAMVKLSAQFAELFQLRFSAYGLDGPLTKSHLVMLGDGPHGKPWTSVILDISVIFMGHGAEKMTDTQVHTIDAMGVNTTVLWDMAMHFYEQYDLVDATQFVVENLPSGVSLEAFKVIVKNADKLWYEYYEDGWMDHVPTFLEFALSQWERFRWVMPKDNEAYILMQLWGGNIEMAWEDPDRFFWDMMSEWEIYTGESVSVDDIKLGIRFRHIMIELYQARMSAYGFNPMALVGDAMNGNFNAKDSLMMELGGDHEMFMIMLEDSDMTEKIDMLSSLNEDQVMTLGQLEFNVTIALTLLTASEPMDPHSAINFYNYYTNNIQPFMPMPRVHEIVMVHYAEIWADFNSQTETDNFGEFAYHWGVYTTMPVYGWNMGDPIPQDAAWMFGLWGLALEDAMEDYDGFIRSVLETTTMTMDELYMAINHRAEYRAYLEIKFESFGFDTGLLDMGASALWMAVAARQATGMSIVTYENLIAGPDEDLAMVREFYSTDLGAVWEWIEGIAGASRHEILAAIFNDEMSAMEIMPHLYDIDIIHQTDGCFNSDLIGYVTFNMESVWASYPSPENPDGFLDFVLGMAGCSISDHGPVMGDQWSFSDPIPDDADWMFGLWDISVDHDSLNDAALYQAFIDNVLEQTQMTLEELAMAITYRAGYRAYLESKFHAYGFDAALIDMGASALWEAINARQGGMSVVTYETLISGPDEDLVAVRAFYSQDLTGIWPWVERMTGMSSHEVLAFIFNDDIDAFQIMTHFYDVDIISQTDGCFNQDVMSYIIVNLETFWASYPTPENEEGFFDFVLAEAGCTLRAEGSSEGSGVNNGIGVMPEMGQMEVLEMP